MSNNKFLIEMGNRIATRRRELNLTQEKVAEEMNISIQSLSCIELGKKAIRPENLYNLCKTLNISADYILSGRKSADQLSDITKKLRLLNDDDYKVVVNLIDHFNKRFF